MGIFCFWHFLKPPLIPIFNHSVKKMPTNRLLAIGISLFVVLISGYLLIRSSPVLTMTIDPAGRLPWGTVITWLGFIAFSCLLFYTSNKLYAPEHKIDRVFSWSMKVLIMAAVCWVPISYGLAGNLSFSFGEKSTFQGGQLAMKLFWGYCYTLVLAPLAVLIMHKVVLVFMAFRRTS